MFQLNNYQSLSPRQPENTFAPGLELQSYSHGMVPVLKSAKRYSSYKGEIGGAPANLVNRDFHATAPNRLWVTDITEFSIPAGKVYLSPVIDCHDGMPVAWTIGTSPNAALANGMLRDACATLKPGETPIIHSD